MAPHPKTVAGSAMAATLALASPAFAHHATGGELPSTLWQGLLSGLGHPIIGMDHFVFIVGIGLMSQLAGWTAQLPLLFILGTVLGCYGHIQGYTIPWVEPAIVLTIAVAAAVVGARTRIPVVILALLLVAAGLFHGYAYGESIVGAERTPLAAYVAGFSAIQYAIGLGSGVALRAIVARSYLSETTAARMAGGGLALLAVIAFVNVALIG
jgi:urease accessory protein